ncbi:uncharacterized protein C6orf47 homolog [Cololabis saira]|uniref:uncharacterized protein C6orf47 homolog n=1 Tax=Cololabis saira TaxID=129043 RepID=UPI002AD4EEF4|nr:uncharacterized protein C6orf47 homolog [Cololabis saira]
MGVAGRTVAWLRSWGGGLSASPTTMRPEQPGGRAGWSSWIWGGWRRRSDLVDEFWEAQEKLPPVEVKDVAVLKRGPEEQPPASRWWGRFLPTLHFWPGPVPRRRNVNLGSECDVDGDCSDYGTPPPSPTPAHSVLSSPFRLFARSWAVDIVPEHYEICFNFLRHLFDLCVVAFLWTVSPPTKLVLEVLGLQGSLKLWFHGMAMFLVSTVGMGGLLWLIQEYLAQFALVYGIVQALVISVSVQQSVILGVDEGNHDDNDEMKKTDEIIDTTRQTEELSSL